MTINDVADRAVMSLMEVAEQTNEMLREKRNEVNVYKMALADAIRRPMGVIPDSAVGLITNDDLDAAEARRVELRDKGRNEAF